MIIPIWWSEPHRIENLDELRANIRAKGGSIHQYEQLLSVLVYMQRVPHFEWVPPGGSPTSAGMRHTLFTAALGWWSIMGWMVTSETWIDHNF